MKRLLFTAEMAIAYLEGRKKQTRRVITASEQHKLAQKYGWKYFTEWPSPYGEPGDRVVLLGSWAVPAEYDDKKPSELPEDVPMWNIYHGNEAPLNYGRKRVGRFVPKFLYHNFPQPRIVWTRNEHIQSISEDDAFAEGINDESGDYNRAEHYMIAGSGIQGGCPAVFCFAGLWDSINGKRYPWEDNPPVRVIRFEQGAKAPGRNNEQH